VGDFGWRCIRFALWPAPLADAQWQLKKDCAQIQLIADSDRFHIERPERLVL